VTSKGGAKQQVTLYYMSQHFGICTTVDALRRITINEKVAWEGRVTSQGSFTIDKSDLFGGPASRERSITCPVRRLRCCRTISRRNSGERTVPTARVIAA
jgi:hypothetical protein